jgi:predicted TIM-barrel fold metal-dependent hydrolase
MPQVPDTRLNTKDFYSFHQGAPPMKLFSCACQGLNHQNHPLDTSKRGFLTGLTALSGAAVGVGGAASLLWGGMDSAHAQNAAKPHRIDIHHHVVPPAYVDAVKDREGVAAPKWSPQASIEDMDMNGIATSVVALIQPGAYFKDVELDRRLSTQSNEYVAKMVQTYPGRFGSFATLPLMDVPGSLKEIEYAMDTLKADGIGLMTSYGTKYLGDKHFWPIWEELNRRGAAIYVHPLMPECCKNPFPEVPPSAIEYATDTTRTIASMLFGGAANKFPNIKWIWSHSGGTMPFLWSRFTRQEVDMKEKAKEVLPNGVLAEVKRFHYDTAQGHHEGAMAALRALIPTSQIMFGSDFPYRKGAEVKDGLAARSFTAEERMAIDRGNALRIMPKLKTI